MELNIEKERSSEGNEGKKERASDRMVKRERKRGQVTKKRKSERMKSEKIENIEKSKKVR